VAKYPKHIQDMLARFIKNAGKLSPDDFKSQQKKLYDLGVSAEELKIASPRATTAGQDIKASLGALGKAGKAAGKERVKELVAKQGYVGFRKPKAIALFAKENPTWTSRTVEGEVWFFPPEEAAPRKPLKDIPLLDVGEGDSAKGQKNTGLKTLPGEASLPAGKDLRKKIEVLKNRANALALSGNKEDALASSQLAAKLEAELDESAKVDAIFDKADPKKNRILGDDGQVRRIPASVNAAAQKKVAGLPRPQGQYPGPIGPDPIGPHSSPIGPPESPTRIARKGRVAAGRAVQASPAGRLGAIGKKMLGSPLKMGLAGAALGVANMVGPDLYKGARESLGFNEDKKTRQLKEMLDATEAIERFGRIQKRRQRDLETMVNVNTEMLARNAPHLFNQIMAGRELPQDATVIGGEPRSDLMREVATQMSQGAFSQGEANGPSFP